MGVIGGALFALLGPLLAGTVLGVPPALRTEARGMLLTLALSVPFVVLSASLRAILEAAQRFDLVNLIRTPTSAAVLIVPAIAASLGADLPAIVLLLLLVLATTAAPTAAQDFPWDIFKARTLKEVTTTTSKAVRSIANSVEPSLAMAIAPRPAATLLIAATSAPVWTL